MLITFSTLLWVWSCARFAVGYVKMHVNTLIGQESDVFEKTSDDLSETHGRSSWTSIRKQSSAKSHESMRMWDQRKKSSMQFASVKSACVRLIWAFQCTKVHSSSSSAPQNWQAWRSKWEWESWWRCIHGPPSLFSSSFNLFLNKQPWMERRNQKVIMY